MGKGDRKTRRGKIFAASYGISRKKAVKPIVKARAAAAGAKKSATSAKKKAK